MNLKERIQKCQIDVRTWIDDPEMIDQLIDHNVTNAVMEERGRLLNAIEEGSKIAETVKLLMRQLDFLHVAISQINSSDASS